MYLLLPDGWHRLTINKSTPHVGGRSRQVHEWFFVVFIVIIALFNVARNVYDRVTRPASGLRIACVRVTPVSSGDIMTNEKWSRICQAV